MKTLWKSGRVFPGLLGVVGLVLALLVLLGPTEAGVAVVVVELGPGCP